MKQRRAGGLGLTATVTASLVVVAAAASASAAQVAQSTVVSAVPAASTPQLSGGAVFAAAQVGSTMVVGGSFTGTTSGGNSTTTPYVVAFDAGSGAVRSTFRPQLDGEVETLLPGPTAGTVYVGGHFKTVKGAPAKSLALLNISDGSLVKGFRAPAMDGAVHTVKRLGSRLLVGGDFTVLGGQPRGGLASLDAASGAVDGFLHSSVAVNHNWTPGGPANHVKAPVGVARLDVTPDGSKMVAIGNFKQVDGTAHDQIAMWDLPSQGTAALRNWRTTALAPACLAATYDSYVRDVAFSPDGSYFSLADTGGYFVGTICDAAARFETAATGQNVHPTWIAYTGGDSLLSTTVTGQAVYVGGHQRWLDNGFGNNKPGPGAVPRPGVAALDPANGVPLAWNPGRNPRGAGTYVLYATGAGLWMGSDTDYIGSNTGGDTRYLRPKIAFFPLSGGRPAAAKTLASLPGEAYLGTTARSFTGTSTGAAHQVSNPLPVSAVRGTTLVGSTLFYGRSDGELYRRTLTSGSLGPETLVDPYDDPVWSDVPSGSGGLDYRGTRPTFNAQIAKLTSLFYDGTGRLFYTMTGRPGLYSRGFSPDSGAITSAEATAPGVSLPTLTGAFLSGGKLYYVTAADGNLHRASFAANGSLGASTVVSGPGSGGVDWRSQVLYLGPTS